MLSVREMQKIIRFISMLLIVLGDGRWTVDGYVIITVYLHETPAIPSPGIMPLT